jgi:hypothetical protein
VQCRTIRFRELRHRQVEDFLIGGVFLQYLERRPVRIFIHRTSTNRGTLFTSLSPAEARLRGAIDDSRLGSGVRSARA